MALPYTIMFNPFSSWAESEGLASPPSVYGALPYPPLASGNSLSLFFPSSSLSDLNCAAVSTHGQVYYNIVTDVRSLEEYTVVKNASGDNIAMIEWKSHPLVEIRGIFDKRPVKDWLMLSREHNSRCMEIKGVQYTWAPRERVLELAAKRPSGAIVLGGSRGEMES